MNPVRAALCVFVLVLVLIGAMVKMAEASEPDACEAQGGCLVITEKQLRMIWDRAFNAGKADGVTACFKGTT